MDGASTLLHVDLLQVGLGALACSCRTGVGGERRGEAGRKGEQKKKNQGGATRVARVSAPARLRLGLTVAAAHKDDDALALLGGNDADRLRVAAQQVGGGK